MAVTGHFMGAVGNFTGLYDCQGEPIHIGDTMIFDEREWGAPYPDNEFIVKFEQRDASISVKGGVSEMKDYGTVTKKWDGRPVQIDISTVRKIA